MSDNLPGRLTTDELVQAAKAANQAGYSKTTGGAYAVMQTAQTLGLSPLAGLLNIYEVQGKPYLSGRLIAALIKQSGDYDYRIDEHTDEACTVVIRKRDKFSGEVQDCEPVRYTMADAKAAGNANKDVWKKYPRRMLFYKAVTDAATYHCPEVTMEVPAYEGESSEPVERASVGAPEPVTSMSPEVTTDLMPDEPVYEGEVVTVKVDDDEPEHEDPDALIAAENDDPGMQAPISKRQRARLWAIAKESLGDDAEDVTRRVVRWLTKQESTSDIPIAAYDAVIEVIKTWPEMEPALVAAEGGENDR